MFPPTTARLPCPDSCPATIPSLPMAGSLAASVICQITLCSTWFPTVPLTCCRTTPPRRFRARSASSRSYCLNERVTDRLYLNSCRHDRSRQSIVRIAEPPRGRENRAYLNQPVRLPSNNAMSIANRKSAIVNSSPELPHRIQHRPIHPFDYRHRTVPQLRLGRFATADSLHFCLDVLNWPDRQT